MSETNFDVPICCAVQPTSEIPSAESPLIPKVSPVSSSTKRPREHSLDPEDFDSDLDDSNVSPVSSSTKLPREHSLDPEDFDSDMDDSNVSPVLVRQNAAVGDALLQAMLASIPAQVPEARPAPGFKICGKILSSKTNKGNRCQHRRVSYGMCANHWKQWKRKNPWLISPGHY